MSAVHNNPESEKEEKPVKTEEKHTKRQLHAMETKDKIYSASVQIINEKGFSNVSIEDITTAANVAKGMMQ